MRKTHRIALMRFNHMPVHSGLNAGVQRNALCPFYTRSVFIWNSEMPIKFNKYLRLCIANPTACTELLCLNNADLWSVIRVPQIIPNCFKPKNDTHKHTVGRRRHCHRHRRAHTHKFRSYLWMLSIIFNHHKIIYKIVPLY